MKLIKKEINQIINFYDLGKIIRIKSFSDGWVNSNFDLETTKGNFVIRVLGKTLSLKIKKNLHLEFNVLKYLEKNKFSLKTPIPLKNNKNQIILKIGDKNI